MAQESGYIIEVSDNGTSGWAQLADLPAGTTSYQHTGLPAGTTKHYRAKAKGNGTTTADSAYAAVVSATTNNPANTTPIAPTSGVVDDTANTFTFTKVAAYAFSEHEATHNGGSTWDAEIVSIDATKAYVKVGNQNKAAGQVGVRVKAADGRNPGNVLWNASAFTAQASTSAPVISNLSASGYPQVGHELTAAYTFADTDGDLEQGSAYQWFRADDAAGTNKTAIAGATAKKHIMVMADELKYLSVRVTPRDSSGASGTALESAAVQVLEEPKIFETAVFPSTTYVTGGEGFVMHKSGSNVGSTATRGFIGDGYIQFKGYNPSVVGNGGGLANGEPTTYSAATNDYNTRHLQTTWSMLANNVSERNVLFADAPPANYFRVRKRGTAVTVETAAALAGPWKTIHTFSVASPVGDSMYFKVSPYGVGSGVAEAKICANTFFTR